MTDRLRLLATLERCAHLSRMGGKRMDRTTGKTQQERIAETEAAREAVLRYVEGKAMSEYVRVPREPTQKMLKAAYRHTGSAYDTYKAMLSAAPADQDKADAERYRFWRKLWCRDDDCEAVNALAPNGFETEAEWDAAIDAAIASTEGGRG